MNDNKPYYQYILIFIIINKYVGFSNTSQCLNGNLDILVLELFQILPYLDHLTP